LLEKAIHNGWLKGLSIKRQSYWWKGFKARASHRQNLHENYLDVLDRLLSQNIILCTHSSRYYEITSLPLEPNLILEVTAPSDYG
jgi:hypothetical protein